MAAGHRLADLKDGYTLAQVKLFARGLIWKREQEQLDRQHKQLDQAEAVALGISEAVAPDENLLGRLRQAILHPGTQPPKPQADLNPKVMASLFGGLPLAE